MTKDVDDLAVFDYVRARAECGWASRPEVVAVFKRAAMASAETMKAIAIAYIMGVADDRAYKDAIEEIE